MAEINWDEEFRKLNQSKQASMEEGMKAVGGLAGLQE